MRNKIKKNKHLILLFFFIISKGLLFSQNLTFDAFQQRVRKYEYTKKSIVFYRSNTKIINGAIKLKNQTHKELEVSFFHADAPYNGAQFRITLKPGETKFLSDEKTHKVNLANDWGVSLRQNKWFSSICFLGDISSYSNGEFSFTLIDEISKNETRIGNQIWMRKNLNVDTFRNGDYIRSTSYDTRENTNPKNAWRQWSLDLRQPFRGWPMHDESNGAKYGQLYNVYAVRDPRGLCPAGWHIPSVAEWDELRMYLKDYGNKLKTESEWDNNGNGINAYLFDAFPSGLINLTGDSRDLGDVCYWWTSTIIDKEDNYCRFLEWDHSWINGNRLGGACGASVRCIKD